MAAGRPVVRRSGKKFVMASMRRIVKPHRKREICPEKRKNRYDPRAYPEA